MSTRSPHSLLLHGWYGLERDANEAINSRNRQLFTISPTALMTMQCCLCVEAMSHDSCKTAGLLFSTSHVTSLRRRGSTAWSLGPWVRLGKVAYFYFLSLYLRKPVQHYITLAYSTICSSINTICKTRCKFAKKITLSIGSVHSLILVLVFGTNYHNRPTQRWNNEQEALLLQRDEKMHVVRRNFVNWCINIRHILS